MARRGARWRFNNQNIIDTMTHPLLYTLAEPGHEPHYPLGGPPSDVCVMQHLRNDAVFISTACHPRSSIGVPRESKPQD